MRWLILLVAVLAGAALWARLEPAAPRPSPGRLTIHGVAPGMEWADVRRLHPTLKSGDGYVQEALLEGDGFYLAVNLRGGRVARVAGAQLEADGVKVLDDDSRLSDVRAALGTEDRNRFFTKGLNLLEFPGVSVLVRREGWVWLGDSDRVSRITLGEL